MFSIKVDKSDEDALEMYTILFNLLSTKYSKNEVEYIFQTESEDDIQSVSAKLHHINVPHTIIKGQQ